MTLRNLRVSKGLTQEQAAVLVGITRRTYLKYEAPSADISSYKYKAILKVIEDYGIYDEEHGKYSVGEIKTICASVLEEYPEVNYCYLFGSYAKNKATERSDIDLLIGMPLNTTQFFEISENLRESLHKKIDLIHISQLKGNDDLVQEILMDGIKIYG